MRTWNALWIALLINLLAVDAAYIVFAAWLSGDLGWLRWHVPVTGGSYLSGAWKGACLVLDSYWLVEALAWRRRDNDRVRRNEWLRPRPSSGGA